jgi:hypothetical protein
MTICIRSSAFYSASGVVFLLMLGPNQHNSENQERYNKKKEGKAEKKFN